MPWVVGKLLPDNRDGIGRLVSCDIIMSLFLGFLGIWLNGWKFNPHSPTTKKCTLYICGISSLLYVGDMVLVCYHIGCRPLECPSSCHDMGGGESNASWTTTHTLSTSNWSNSWTHSATHLFNSTVTRNTTGYDITNHICVRTGFSKPMQNIDIIFKINTYNKQPFFVIMGDFTPAAPGMNDSHIIFTSLQ